MTNEDKKEDEKPESDIVKALRLKYEKALADKDKIIKDLIESDNPKKSKNQSIIEDEEDEDEDIEEKKNDEEKRRQKRMEYYKKHIH